MTGCLSSSSWVRFSSASLPSGDSWRERSRSAGAQGSRGRELVTLSHLVPDAAERVVGEELDHVARGEELVADGQLAAVARGLRASRIGRRSSSG